MFAINQIHLSIEMEEKPLKVATLEDMAVTACYQDITSSLQLAKQISSSSLITLYPDMSLSNVVQLFLEKFSFTYGPILKDQIKKKLVDEFLKHSKSETCSCTKPDATLFLDCVLDESITEPEIHVSEADPVDEKNLIDVMANRSLKLSTLKISFSKKILLTEGMMKSLAKSFVGLQFLTQLNIRDIPEDGCLTLFQDLGPAVCPKLTDLSIESEYLFEDIHVLTLVFGDKAKLFPRFQTGL